MNHSGNVLIQYFVSKNKTGQQSFFKRESFSELFMMYIHHYKNFVVQDFPRNPLIMILARYDTNLLIQLGLHHDILNIRYFRYQYYRDIPLIPS